jgi:hypothetical protein
VYRYIAFARKKNPEKGEAPCIPIAEGGQDRYHTFSHYTSAHLYGSARVQSIGMSELYSVETRRVEMPKSDAWINSQELVELARMPNNAKLLKDVRMQAVEMVGGRKFDKTWRPGKRKINVRKG